jgi:predicted small secreted protein
MKKLVLLSVLVMSTGMLSACNTVQGVGQDLEKAGQSIQSTF